TQLPVPARQRDGAGFHRCHPDRSAAGVYLRLRGHRFQVFPCPARRRDSAAVPLQWHGFPRGADQLRGATGALGSRGSLRHAGVGVARARPVALPRHRVGAVGPRHHRRAGEVQIRARSPRDGRRDPVSLGLGHRQGPAVNTDWDLVRAIADAVLYEGYLLYPYRATSGKNQSRWQFGVLGPQQAADRGIGEDDTMSAQVLVDPGPAAALTIVVRCLQLQRRTAEREVAGGNGGNTAYEPVDELTAGGQSWLTWDEAVE